MKDYYFRKSSLFLFKARGLLSSVLALSISLLNVQMAQAQTADWATREAELGVVCSVNGVATIQGIMCLLANVMSVFLTLIGIAGFVMLVFGSIKWLISGGNSQTLESSKKTITYAFIGLILALGSVLIINIIARFTGINVIERFFIPSSDTGVNNLDEWDNI